MWLLIIVGLGILVIPFVIDVMAWLFLLAGIILIVSFFFHALVWLVPLFMIYYVGQKLIDRHYLKTGKGEFWASKKVKEKKSK